MSCKDRLERFLTERRIPFEVHSHDRAVTAQEVAAADHIPGRMLAKSVMVVADGALAMLVLPAPYHVDLGRAGALLGDPSVRLATEEEFADRFPGCELGAMPAFGNLYDVPVYVDASLALNERIATQPGNHRDLLVLGYEDYVKAVRPSVGDFAVTARAGAAGR